MGDVIFYVVVFGVVLVYVLNIFFVIGVFIFGFGVMVAIGYVKFKIWLKEDVVIGIVFMGFFVFGLVLVIKIFSNVDLFYILFGNVLGIF